MAKASDTVRVLDRRKEKDAALQRAHHAMGDRGRKVDRSTDNSTARRDRSSALQRGRRATPRDRDLMIMVWVDYPVVAYLHSAQWRASAPFDSPIIRSAAALQTAELAMLLGSLIKGVRPKFGQYVAGLSVWRGHA